MDAQLQTLEVIVRREIEKADHLSPEHKEVLSNDLIEALRCANGEPDKIPIIARVVAMSSLRRIRAEVRFSSDVGSAVDQAMIGLKAELPEIIATAFRIHFQEHSDLCPARNFDPEAFGQSLEDRIVSRLRPQKPQLPKTWGGLARKCVSDISEQYPLLIGLSAVLLFWKYGPEGVVQLVKGLASVLGALA